MSRFFDVVVLFSSFFMEIIVIFNIIFIHLFHALRYVSKKMRMFYGFIIFFLPNKYAAVACQNRIQKLEIIFDFI
jgi:hypothetical protein